MFAQFLFPNVLVEGFYFHFLSLFYFSGYLSLEVLVLRDLQFTWYVNMAVAILS